MFSAFRNHDLHDDRSDSLLVLTSMGDHNNQALTPREMVRAHAYPVLALAGSLSLGVIAVLQIPTAVKDHRYNRCIDQQMELHRAVLAGQEGQGKTIYLKAVKQCEGR